MHNIETQRMIGKVSVELDGDGHIIFPSNHGKMDLLNIKPGKSQFMFYDKDNRDKLIFHMGITNKRSRVEVSYGTETPYRNKGYAKEGLKGALEWLFKNTNEDGFYALTTDNFVSEAVLKGCGFEFCDKYEESSNWFYISTI